jgi:hypothetical protein
MRSLAFLLGTLPTLLTAVACASAEGIEARAVVERYCQLDFDGARLGISEDATIWTLVAWENEPGWDTTLIASSFRVERASQDESIAEVTVEYRLVGRFEGEPPTILETTTERVKFRLALRHQGWVIEEGQVPPHVSARVFRVYLETLLKEERDAKRRSALQHDIERIRKLE